MGDWSTFYLNPFGLFSDDAIDNKLTKLGYWKLLRIRNATINVRHILQSIFATSKKFEKHVYYSRLFFEKYLKGYSNLDTFETFVIRNLIKVMKAIHKSKRDGSGEIVQIFDFDKTVASFKDDIEKLLNKGVAKIRPSNENHPSKFVTCPDVFKLKRIIVSGCNGKEKVINYLEAYNLKQYFDNIYVLNGDKAKARFLYGLRERKNYDIIYYYDDTDIFAYGVLGLFFVPFMVKGIKIKKIFLG